MGPLHNRAIFIGGLPDSGLMQKLMGSLSADLGMVASTPPGLAALGPVDPLQARPAWPAPFVLSPIPFSSCEPALGADRYRTSFCIHWVSIRSIK